MVLLRHNFTCVTIKLTIKRNDLTLEVQELTIWTIGLT